jgi:hypothetical protein
MKKGLLGLLVLGGLLVAPSGALAAGGGFCVLDGTANFSTPLKAPAGPGDVSSPPAFGYSFFGTLANCAGSDAQATGATVSAGLPASDSHNPFGRDEPSTTAVGTCVNSTTSGISFVKWSDGKLTIVSYDTSGAAAAVALTGTVLGSYTFPATATQPALTVSTTRYAGGYSGGPLAFEPPDPTACNGAGVTTAKIQGLLGIGSQS